MQSLRVLALCAASAAAVEYRNPVLAGDCPDPGVVYDPAADMYYMVNTGRLTIRQSPNLVNWTESGKSYYPALPAWTAPGYLWAPEVHKVNATHYAVMFTTPYAQNVTGVPVAAKGQLSVGIGHSTSASGPFTDLGRPIVADAVYGSIDQSFFRDPKTGRNYLMWKRDSETPTQPSTPIYIQEVTQGADALVGERKVMIQDDQVWEQVPAGGLSNIEAPWMVYNNATGYYYLFYSGGMFDGPYYNVGVARATSPMGNWTKFSGPILHTRWGAPYVVGAATDFYGPGHPSILQRPCGTWAMVYHAWGKNKGGGRHVMADTIVWKEGWPRVVSDTPSFELTEMLSCAEQ
eukprot:TRINITY_DN4973_c0_g1_i1.p2 TRINITY_DN4973_c0_g1~~TRINITY_DN4973_c0_g1_i1.p2  ORF type:complete len:366 (+),score=154.82 TRINITY_DN4973_c0_g1_i1:58-1098(+)